SQAPCFIQCKYFFPFKSAACRPFLRLRFRKGRQLATGGKGRQPRLAGRAAPVQDRPPPLTLHRQLDLQVRGRQPAGAALGPFHQPQPGRRIVQAQEFQLATRSDPVQVQVQRLRIAQRVALDQGVGGAADGPFHPQAAQPGPGQGGFAGAQVAAQVDHGGPGLGGGQDPGQAGGRRLVSQRQARGGVAHALTSARSGANRSDASIPRSPPSAAARSPATACSSAPVAAASKASRPCARSAAVILVSTSPLPPLARPGLPAATTCGSAPGAATTVPAPLSTTTQPKRSHSRRAAAYRSACTSAVATPSRRAASPGCGVRMASPASGCTGPPLASRLSASASSTSGLPAASATPNSAEPQADCPSPGPIATMPARSSSGRSAPAPSTARAITSGRRARAAATCA